MEINIVAQFPIITLDLHSKVTISKDYWCHGLDDESQLYTCES